MSETRSLAALRSCPKRQAGVCGRPNQQELRQRAGQIESGTPLRPDVIAHQLVVSTTPVREAMHRLESDGLAVKLSYQGWFVCEFTNEQIQELYEFRAALESCGVRLACERITEAELAWLRNHQSVGEAALAAGDRDAYRIYNRDLHAAIIKAARSSYLVNAGSKNRPFPLTKIDPHEEQDLPRGKRKALATSSTPKARKPLRFRHARVVADQPAGSGARPSRRDLPAGKWSCQLQKAHPPWRGAGSLLASKVW